MAPCGLWKCRKGSETTTTMHKHTMQPNKLLAGEQSEVGVEEKRFKWLLRQQFHRCGSNFEIRTMHGFCLASRKQCN